MRKRFLCEYVTLLKRKYISVLNLYVTVVEIFISREQIEYSYINYYVFILFKIIKRC